MLLLTAVTFGSSESTSSLDFLGDEEAELLKHRAQELLQIPREKRIPLLVQEIKRLVNARKGQLWAADPQKLAQILSQERPVLVEVLLKAFPAALADAVRAQLPPTHARMVRDPNPEILSLLRWKLEDVLTRMGTPHAPFKFSDVIRLHSRELLTLVDAIGAKVLGPAVAGLPDAERDPLIAALPPDHRQLLTKAMEASVAAGRRLEEKDAREALEPHGLATAAAGVVRSSGIQRLARACLAQGSEFAALLVEKYPGELGRQIARWVRDERARAVNRGDGGRTEFVQEMERLESLGLLTKPVRLPPAAPKQQGRGGAGGPVLGGAAATPSMARGSPPKQGLGVPGQRVEATHERDAQRQAFPAPSPKRDWVAERRMRQTGMAAPDDEKGKRRDPIAERRNAAPGDDRGKRRDFIAERRMAQAGMGPSRTYDAVREGEKPTGQRPAPRASKEHTAPLPEKRPIDKPPSRALTSPTTTKPPALKRAPTHEGVPVQAGTNVARPPRVSGQHAVPPRRPPQDDE